MNQDNNILIYQDEDGTTRVSVLFSDEDIWLTQDQIAELYNTTQQNISQHIAGIISDGELDKEATHKKFLLVRTEGSRQVKRNIDHYNFDMIIALGYRVQSQVATRFRRWATISSTCKKKRATSIQTLRSRHTAVNRATPWVARQ